ncbi:hypothetical protein [Leuconostoc gelidum]|uniref:hypothetical protein n=1 Tax=Leuconostoc gelidum TaxID=1244 RepID=UPI001C7E0A65|nr:hypothetical protein [Leuconostoc gelidum]MBZ6009094.1 hypothetical protein [Leuconostoc gelidum subsp. aenigmaticum]MBZ6009896.1 hypothetical protein [Leuconostoc gelidum subsp. aenigmaticum]
MKTLAEFQTMGDDTQLAQVNGGKIIHVIPLADIYNTITHKYATDNSAIWHSI